MKATRFHLAAVAIALSVAALFTLIAPEAHAVVLFHASTAALPGSDLLHHLSIASPALLALKSKRTDFAGRAASLLAELTDQTPAERQAEIETEHDGILAEIRSLDAQIAEAERAAATQPAPTAPVGGLTPADVQRMIDERVNADRARASEIRSLGARFGQQTLADQHAAGTTSVDAFRNLLIDALAADQERHGGPTGGGHNARIEVVSDESDVRRERMAGAIAFRMEQSAIRPGVRPAEAPEQLRQYVGMQLIEVAAECIGYRGLIRTARQADDVMARAFAGHSVSDFPALFLDAMNRRLLARYAAATPTYRYFAAPYTAVDFRSLNVLRAGDFPALLPVGENGEIKSGTFSESKELFKVDPYGVRMNISRQMIVNDSLNAIEQIMGSAGVRVTDWENAKVFALLAANPQLATDNKAVFHAGHGNLAGAGSAITVASIGAGRAAMMKQKTLDGILANFTPTYLLTGPDKQTEAEQLVTAIVPNQTGQAVPETIRRLAPVADANVTGNQWYLFADPAVAPCFIYGYLEGFSGPRMTSEQKFDVQGMSVKLEHDFGAAAIDYRGGYSNAGA